jgi:hypothetical protein
LAACFGADVSLSDALVLHAPDYVRGEAERWGAMVARIAPPAPVVLGRWDVGEGWFVRYPIDAEPLLENAIALSNDVGAHVALDKCPMFRVPTGGQEGASAVDEWMRAQGWVLLDAEPVPWPTPMRLRPWRAEAGDRRRRLVDWSNEIAVEVAHSEWRVNAIRGFWSSVAAHGPQTGAEGERLAMVAACALGFVEGT